MRQGEQFGLGCRRCDRFLLNGDPVDESAEELKEISFGTTSSSYAISEAGVAGDFQRFRMRICDFLVCRRCGILDGVISSTVKV